MAIVQGIREKCHLPIYDSVSVDGAKQLREVEASSTLKFFVNVQGKTKLETNLQSASLLPHYNTFEARAMRVVISDLPPTFSDEVIGNDEDLPVTDGDGNALGVDGQPASTTNPAVTADVEIPLDHLVELLQEAKEDDQGIATIDVDDGSDSEITSLKVSGTELTQAQ